MRSSSAARSARDGGSDCTSSAVSRPTPSGTLVAQRRPAASPIMSSTLPPPMSMHSAGAGSSTRLARTAAKIEPGLLEPADHLDLDAGLGLDAVDELAAVGGGADRARRLGDHLLRARARRRAGGAAGRSRRRGRPWGRRDPAVAGDVVAEAQHVLLAGDGVERAVGVHVGDEQVEGVRSEVERRDAHADASVPSARALTPASGRR